MTVQNTDAKNTYPGTGVALAFNFTFPIIREEDLLVQVKAVDNTITDKMLTTDYTVTGVGNRIGDTNYTQGTVTFLVAPLATDIIIIKRGMSIEQGTDYTQGGQFPAEAHEEALDELTMIAQQLNEGQERTVKFDSAVDLSSFSTDIPGASAGQFLQTNATNTGFEFSTLAPGVDPLPQLATDAGSSLIGHPTGSTVAVELSTLSSLISHTYDTVALASAAAIPLNTVVSTAGYASAGDGGGALYVVRTEAAAGTPDGFGNHYEAGGNVLDLQGPNDVRKFGAVGDGVANDTAAIMAADAAGGAVFTSGTYLMSGASTLTNNAAASSGVTIELAASASLDFDSHTLNAPEERIFNLDAAGSQVTNLRRVFLSWFVQHLVGTLIDSASMIQKAVDSAVTDGVVHLQRGALFTDSLVTVSSGQILAGMGRGVTEFLTGTNPSLFVFSTASAPSGYDFTIRPADVTTLPVSGTVMLMSAQDWRLRNVEIDGGYDGLTVNAKGSAKGMSITNSINAGLWAEANQNTSLLDVSIVATKQWIDISSVVGTFVVGETITGSAGASGTVVDILTPTMITVEVSTYYFLVAENLTGGTSGATAQVSSFTDPHQGGGLRIQEGVQHLKATAVEVRGGKYALRTDSTVTTIGSRPEYLSFTGCTFVGGELGSRIDRSHGCTFDNCQFSGVPGDGLVIGPECSFMSFTGCLLWGSWLNGCYIYAGAIATKFIGCNVSSNNRVGTIFDGIAFAAGVTDFVVTGNSCGGSHLGGGVHRFGIHVNAGASDRYIIADNGTAFNGTAGVMDNGTGVSKRVANNY